MKTSNEILKEVRSILRTTWERRTGRKVPEAEDIKLGNDAVTLDGTVLYADMTDSTGLVKGFKDWFAADIYKSYLLATCHIIRNLSGVITAFDGDRVMAVFIGETKNTSAAKAALQISWITRQINAEIKAAYPSSSYQLEHAIGIDTSPLFVAKTGIRNNNDLVWVGRAANYAAKLCSLSDSTYSIYITDDVHKMLHESAKYGGSPQRSMWEKTMWQDMGIVIHRSSWWWQF